MTPTLPVFALPMRLALAAGLALALAGCRNDEGAAAPADADAVPPASTSASPSRAPSAIFLHPDGMGANTWMATRLMHVGPDGRLAWDALPDRKSVV